MNKFLSAILIGGASLAIYSCNNGAYDAQLSNNTGLNPLNPNSGVTIPVGQMKATINKVTYPFYPADYIDEGDGFIFFSGSVPTDEPSLPNESLFKRRIDVTFANEVSDKEFALAYSFIDTTIDSFVTYQSLLVNDKPSITLKAKGKSSNNYYGTFSGTLYRRLPKQDLNDSITITNGEYHLPKRIIKK